MDAKIYEDKLNALLKKSAHQKISIKDIRKEFGDIKLNKKQLDAVKEFLRRNNIEVFGASKISNTPDVSDMPSGPGLIDEPMDEDLTAMISNDADDPNSPVRDAMSSYLSAIGDVQLLTHEEEIELGARVKAGDEKARNIFMERNLKLVVSIAKHFVGRGLDLEDLVQEGNLGLYKAVMRYEPEMGYRFSTYATWWIRQQITRALADKGRTIRIPVHMNDTINKLATKTRELELELGHHPSVEELSAATGKDAKEIDRLIKLMVEPTSLYIKVGDTEDTDLIDFIPDDTGHNVENLAEQTMLREDIDRVLENLSEKEADVIRMRFGLDDNPPMTLEECGNVFGVTRERVRQIEAKALRKLRGPKCFKILKAYRPNQDAKNSLFAPTMPMQGPIQPSPLMIMKERMIAERQGLNEPKSPPSKLPSMVMG